MKIFGVLLLAALLSLSTTGCPPKPPKPPKNIPEPDIPAPRPDPLPVPPQPNQRAIEEADQSARSLSEIWEEDVSVTRQRYCNLLDAYEAEFSIDSFVPWAEDELGIQGPPSFEVEEALIDLEEAIVLAQQGDAFEGLVAAVCVG